MINPYILETHKDRLVNDAFINFKFFEKTHKYTSKENDNYISITTLLKAMCISPNYADVNEDILGKAKQYGELIHSEIEMWSKEDKTGITDELDNFIRWVKKNKINLVASEYMVHDSRVAGTIDLIYRENNDLVISDIKTTSIVHKESVSWQLSLYRYLLGEDIKKATCIHIRPNLYEVVDIPLKSNEECERLINCYFNQEPYEVAILEEQQIQTLLDLQAYIEDLKNKQKEAENKLQEIKNLCMDALDKNNLLSVEIETEDKKIKITKVAPKDKEVVDYKTLINDHPEIEIDKYKSYTPVKPYIKIS